MGLPILYENLLEHKTETSRKIHIHVYRFKSGLITDIDRMRISGT